MSASNLSRLERLETAINQDTRKTRKHFTSGILSGAQGDLVMTFADNNGKPLDGWHWLEDDIVFVVDIE